MPGKRGPRRSLTHAEFLDAALAVVDAHGLSQLNIRRIAAGLGVSHTLLYTYFSNKDELLDALLAHALRDVPAEPVTSGDWLALLEEQVRAIHGAAAAHPGVVELLMRNVGAPQLDAPRRRLLQIVELGGFEPAACVRTINMLVALVLGCVINDQLRVGERRTAEFASDGRRPTGARAAGVSADEEARDSAFDVGLRALLREVAEDADRRADQNLMTSAPRRRAR